MKLMILSPFFLFLIFSIFSQEVFAKNSSRKPEHQQKQEKIDSKAAIIDAENERNSTINFKKTLNLADYLQQVQMQNLKIAAADQFTDSYDLLQEKGKLITAIRLYGFSESSFVEQNQALQFLRYKTIYSQNNRIGFSQNSEFGLKTDFYYSLNNVKYSSLNTTNLPNSTYARQNSQAIPTIEISMPIWQNRFGSSTRASKEAVFSENISQKYAAKALSTQEIIDAEKSYWQLVFAKKSFEIQSQALNSAQKILNYVAKKQRMNLGEESDVLQAKAMLESRRLEVWQAQNSLKIAARNFNKKRNLISEEVNENLANFNLEFLEKFKVNEIRKDDRPDIKAQKAQADSATAYAKVEEENNKPSVNIYGAYSVNQVEHNRQDAIGTTFQNNAPAGKIGVELSMPLNFGLTSTIGSGARKKASAEKISYREKLQQQEVDWQNLVQNLRNYQQNLQLANTIENIQKAKLENERVLLHQGRTSTYQILVFEQEFANSKLNTQQIAEKFYEAIADQKLYGE